MVDSGKIKHILLDLGGVLLNIDYKLTEQAFVDLGLVDFKNLYSQSKQEGLFDDFEKGILSRKMFISLIQDKFTVDVNPDTIEKAWNAMLLDFPKKRVDMLIELKKSYNIFLLSNTNAIHFEAFNKHFENSYKSSFSSYFDCDFYSHLIGKRKPDTEVFEFILQKEKLNKDELLFVDDSNQHIQGAENLGIPTLLLEKGDDVISLLRRYGILTEFN